MNAMIINDHPLAIAAIRNLLIKDDTEILAELTEGGSAVQRMEALRPNIIVIDVDIPGVNGTQVLGTLRKRQYDRIIIIVSAENDHFYGKRCADAGANGLMNRKEGMDNIITAIEAIKSGYCYSPFSLNRLVGSLMSNQQKLDSLSRQGISVMRYVPDNKGNNDIAEEMFISNKTVGTYKSRLIEKLECKSLIDLYTFAQRGKID